MYALCPKIKVININLKSAEHAQCESEVRLQFKSLSPQLRRSSRASVTWGFGKCLYFAQNQGGKAAKIMMAVKMEF